MTPEKNKSASRKGLHLCILVILSTLILQQQTVMEWGNISSITKDSIITALGKNSTITTSHRKVHWFNSSKIKQNDYFAGAWLMPKEAFLQIPTHNMFGLEDSVHIVYTKHTAKVRMSEDWMDFSVEHMSRWWKVLLADQRNNDSVGINRIIGAFKDYRDRNTKSMASDHSLQSTIAIIPYQTSLDERSVQALKWSSELSVVALQATIASVARLGFGRIVVVTVSDFKEEVHVQKALNHFQRNNGTKTTTEYSHVQITNETWYNTKTTKKNLPVGSVKGLQKAFQGKLSNNETIQWLGESAGNWSYIYYTEPDTILQTRMSALPTIRNALDEGMVLMPHRWQPFPHYMDVDGARGYYIRSDGGQLGKMAVMELDRENDSCCDMNEHPSNKYWGCGNFWYLCGFAGDNNVKHTNQDSKHQRLVPYGFMKIKGGMGIVSLRATEHGRICRPVQGRPGFVCNSKS